MWIGSMMVASHWIDTTVRLIVVTAVGAVIGGAQLSPLDVVRSSNERILDVYASNPAIDEAAEAEVTRIMDSVTSFEALGDGAIDAFCDQMTEATCREFKQVFQELLRETAIRRLGRYRAEAFEYLEETVDGEAALVKTLASYGDNKVELDYHLERVNDRWLIVNYVVDGIDTVRNYNRQFSRQLSRETPEQVIERLRRRKAEIEAEKETSR